MQYTFQIDQFVEILSACPEYESGHHFGRPFMSAYQLAIEFSIRHPTHEAVRTLSIGGMGTGSYQSLAQQIARFLSQAIKHQTAGAIEGAFISHLHMNFLSFSVPESHGSVQASTLESKNAHSIFRVNCAPVC